MELGGDFLGVSNKHGALNYRLTGNPRMHPGAFTSEGVQAHADSSAASVFHLGGVSHVMPGMNLITLS